MRYNVLNYLIGEGFSNVFKNKKQALTSFGMMTVTMILFGICFIVAQNLNHFVKQVESGQGIQVYIQNDATNDEVEELGKQIKQISGVNTTEFISKEQALEQMKDRLGDRGYLLDGYEEVNIFPASYIVTLTDLSLSSNVQVQINELDNVKRITSSDETINTLVKIAKGIRIVTYVVLIALIIFCIFIISNTIKLTVHARRKEISIMKYVGATNGFIRTPFMIEGVIIGLVSSVLSLGIIGILYNAIVSKLMTSDTIQTIGVSILSFNNLFTEIVVVYLILGIGIGILGSSISMKKYLDV